MMKLIGNDSRLQVYSEDEIKVLSELPTGNYQVKYSPMGGYFLQHYPSYKYQEHLYGGVDDRVKQVLSLFKKRDRNLGAILSGTKGMGKTVFSKQLSVLGYKNNIPTLIIEESYPGLKDFLNSITQPVIVQFDEFEKNFPIEDDHVTSQADLLNLFDGTSTYKKLFVITCNNEQGLSSFILNRPGRFHYHFRFDSVTPAIVREYFKLNLEIYNEQAVEKVVMLSDRTRITYDYLNAIAVELNLGASLEDALSYLNIDVYSENVSYKFTVTLKDGTHFSGVTKTNLSQDIVQLDIRAYTASGVLYSFDGSFSSSNVTYDYNTGISKVERIIQDDYVIEKYGKDEDGDKDWIDVASGIESITFARNYTKKGAF